MKHDVADICEETHNKGIKVFPIQRPKDWHKGAENSGGATIYGLLIKLWHSS